jgi:hypothetical protein
MVSVRVLMGSCSSLVRPKTIKLVFFASLVKYATLRRKSKDWLALNQYNVSKWDDNFYFDNMSINILLYTA